MLIVLLRRNVFWLGRLLGGGGEGKIDVGIGLMGQGKQTKHTAARRYQRVALPKGMLVAWQCSDGRGVARVSTLGLGGLFMTTPDPPPVGTLVKLLFDVPGGEVRARATVKNIKPGEGMAVAFVDMESPDRARLNQLVKRLS